MPTDRNQVDIRHLVGWPWQAVLLAHVCKRSADGSSDLEGKLLLVSPTADGLDAIEATGHTLSALWVLTVNTDDPGALLGYRVEEMAKWESTTSAGRHLVMLRGSGEQQIAIDGENLFVHGSTSSSWRDCRQYKRKAGSSRE